MSRTLLEIPEPWVGKRQEEVCTCLFDHLVSTQKDNLQLLSYLSIARVCNEGVIDEYVVEIITYLCSDRVNILHPSFVLIDEEDNEFPLERGEVLAAKRNGFIVHPDTGEQIHEYRDMVFINFSVTEEFLEVYR